MRILVCSDDGYRVGGIEVLAESLRALASVHIIDPFADRSDASNSLTLDRPLRVTTAADGTRSVDRTPAGCINFAFHRLLGESLDLVVSGINAGENLGDDGCATRVPLRPRWKPVCSVCRYWRCRWQVTIPAIMLARPVPRPISSRVTTALTCRHARC